MNENYPVYAKLTEQKLLQLGLDAADLEASPLNYIDPAWDYAAIFKLLVYFQHRVESTIAIISSVEIVDNETNTKLNTRLDELISYLEQVKLKLNDGSKQ